MAALGVPHSSRDACRSTETRSCTPAPTGASPRPALPPHTHAPPAVKLRLSRTHTHTHATPHAMKLRLSYAAMKLRLSQTHTHRNTSSYEASAELLGCEASAEPHAHPTHGCEATAEPGYEATAEPPGSTALVVLPATHASGRVPPPGGSCLRHVTNHT